jgi:hypothetical protein
VRRWLDTDEIRAIGYSAYWNDEEVEKEKAGFWTLEGDFARMETCLAENTTVARELEDLLSEVAPLGSGADLAAGTLWAVLRLVAHGAEIVYAVEYSEHRLLKLGPGVLAHYGVPLEQVVLCLGPSTTSDWTIGRSTSCCSHRHFTMPTDPRPCSTRSARAQAGGAGDVVRDR